MKVQSYYVNMRPRWSLIARLWNLFFGNLKKDYRNLYQDINGHDIHNSETDLQNNISGFLMLKKGESSGWFQSGWFTSPWFH